MRVIGHGIVVGNYLAKWRNLLNGFSVLYVGERQLPGSVTANIESLSIRNYRLTISVYSNLRFFQEPYIRIYGFFWSFCEVFLQRVYDSYHTNSYDAFFTLRLHASDTSEIRKKNIDIRNPTVS